ncbi:MAG: protein kinase [Gammaproteobacteria bacterium]
MIVVYNKPICGTQLLLYKRDRIGEGGEGAVYAREWRNGEKIAIKIFNERKLRGRGDSLSQKIIAMVNHPDKKALLASQMVAWPKWAAYDKNGRVIGYAMRHAEGKQLSRLAHPMLYKKHFLDMDREKVSQMLIRLWDSVHYLHQRQIYIGDINTSNVLCTERYEICWIDADSFQVDGHRCLVGRPEMTPPEHRGKNFADIDRTRESDLFSLAILTFLCLMLGRHPYDRIGGKKLVENLRKGHFPYAVGGARPGESGGIPKGEWHIIWSHYTRLLKGLFVRALKEGVADSSKRPSAGEWKNALRLYVKTLNHSKPALRENGKEYWPPKEMVPNEAKPRDLRYHGKHVPKIVAWRATP